MSTYGPTFLTESPQVSLSIEKNYKLNRYVALYVHTYCSKKVSTKSRPSNLQQPKHLLRVDLASPTYAPFIVGLNGVFYSRTVEILPDVISEHLLKYGQKTKTFSPIVCLMDETNYSFMNNLSEYWLDWLCYIFQAYPKYVAPRIFLFSKYLDMKPLFPLAPIFLD